MLDTLIQTGDRRRTGWRNSTVEQPLASQGVEHVLVNGVPVVDAGRHTGARPGRNLLRV